jgi:hypothetical protein
MSETPERYLLQTSCKPDTLSTDLRTLQNDLEDLERKLIASLVTVQRALGKEPSVLTRLERRRR